MLRVSFALALRSQNGSHPFNYFLRPLREGLQHVHRRVQQGVEEPVPPLFSVPAIQKAQITLQMALDHLPANTEPWLRVRGLLHQFAVHEVVQEGASPNNSGKTNFPTHFAGP